ncbi:MAG: chloride channel protein [Bdellovibrionaceae bacterium]|nr:chloride channel protein [Pseudobdellovibrionaceae bacterium]
MKPTEFLDIPTITRKALREIPKSWNWLLKPEIQQFTNREIIQLNTLAILVGVLTGYAGIGFRYMIGAMQNLILYGQWDYHLISPMDHIRGYWMFLILPASLVVSTLLTKYFAPEARGHGIPEVIQSVWGRGGKIRKRIVALKALASSITIASGGSVGREGPIVQIGSAIGSSLGQLLHLKPAILKTLVGCGAAGAIASTFNTPIAGVIFAIEIIVLELKTKSFVPLVISSVFATVIARLYIGNEPAFFVPEHSLKSPNELIFYLFLGVLSGIVGVIVIKTLYGIEDFFDNLEIPFLFKPIIAGVIVAAIGMKFPHVLSVGYEAVSSVLQQKSELSLMLALVFLKMISMSVTLAGGGSGGVFSPSLYIGAMLGGSYGYVVHYFFPEMTSNYGAYALVGMAALFSATARATFTAIVILFEMTLDYSIILPLMFVCVTADQVAWFFSKDSIYSLKLRRSGIKFATDISVNVMSMTVIKDIMTTELHKAIGTMTIIETANKLLQHNHSIYPVVNEEGILTGLLTHEKLVQLSKKHPKALVSEVQQEAKAVVHMNDSAIDALAKIEKSRDPRILVVDSVKGKLVGVVSPIDFVRLNIE